MATEALSAEGAAVRTSHESRPYAPSWVDLVMRRIEALPGPTWLAYLVLLLVSMFIAAVEGWIGGISQFPELDPVQIGFGVFFVTPLAVLHYLNNSAGTAWDRFRPVTNLDDAEAARMRYTLTTSPARMGWMLLVLAYVLNAAWYWADPVGTQVLGKPLPYTFARWIVEGFIFATVLMLGYRVIRQLQIVNHLHDSATRIDLFQPRAVHAMSHLTARNAIGIVFLAVFVSWPYPGIGEQTIIATIILFAIPMLVLAAAAFFAPLRGLHDRLVDEKSRLQGANVARIKETIEAIHRLVETEAANAGDLEQSRQAQTRIDSLSKAQTALIQERDLIARLSTWPWDPSTLRAVISAIALPIVLFLITRVLDRFV